MEIKWIRDLDGNIGKRVEDHLAKKQNGEIFTLFLNGMYKVKDTVQELIEVEDLIILKGYWEEPLFVSFIDNQGHPRATVRTSSGSESIDLSKYYDFITKILTPKGKDYICQWEAE